MLSVFGPELGPERQTQVALLLLLICIVLEIYGEPYLMETSKHKILGRFELSALLIEWSTMWSGLMLFQLDGSKTSDQGVAVALTVFIVLTNTILMLCFVVQLILVKLAEKKEEARLAALKPIERRKSFFSDGLSALRRKFSSAGDIELPGIENPMPRMQETGGEVKKQEEEKNDEGVTGRQDNSVYKRAPRTKTSDTMHTDAETGLRYSFNEKTGAIKWFPDLVAEEEEETIHKDAKSGRRFSYNGKTKVSTWLTDRVAEEEEGKRTKQRGGELSKTQTSALFKNTNVSTVVEVVGMVIGMVRVILVALIVLCVVCVVGCMSQ
jgi:hypothetical protein